jgi:hypothetical protein
MAVERSKAMTDDEIRAAIKEASDKVVANLGPKYEQLKVESDSAYRKLVADLGKRAANTLIMVVIVTIAFAAGWFARGL